jgi:hypothetical protein
MKSNVSKSPIPMVGFFFILRFKIRLFKFQISFFNYRSHLESEFVVCKEWDPADFDDEELFLRTLRESNVDCIIALHAYKAGKYLSDRGKYTIKHDMSKAYNHRFLLR